MAKRTFVDAPTEARCQWNRRLRDGTFAQCGRRHIDGELCAQHAKMDAENPDLTDPVVKKAAQLVVDSFSADDVAREDLRDGFFDASQMQPGYIFRAMVRFMRTAVPTAQAVDLGPVRVLADHAAGRINHANNGLCPDEVEGHDTRDPDCPVCCALIESQTVGNG